MALTCTVCRSDNAPLGDAESVKRNLSEAFAGVRFILVTEEPRRLAAIEKQLPLFLRIWMSVFGEKIQYPHYHCALKSTEGWAIEFYFAANEPIFRIRATAYGMTASLNKNFDRLSAATGWVVKHPRL